jgi:D-xylulose reductase
MCLGHESSGVIVKLGPDVTKTRKLELGQRVALEPGVVCRVCEFCKAGQYEVSLLFLVSGEMGFEAEDHSERE